MDRKIQELTEKIYREGVEKGEQKAKQLIEDAEKRAASLVAAAQAERKMILEETQRKAAALKETTMAEIRRAGNQAVALIRQQIADALLCAAIDVPTLKTLSDPQVLKELLLSVASHWKESAGSGVKLEAVLPAALQDAFLKNFQGSANEMLKRGLSVSFSKTISAGFRIGPAGESFKVSFTDEDFNEFFKEFLLPRTRTLLFGGKE